MKHTQGKWYETLSKGNDRGVRTSAGYICFLTKPNHYTGQDERYELEMAERRADAKLIAAAPEMLEMLIDIQPCIDLAINATPTGMYRNTLTEMNIKALSLINSIEP